MIELRSTKKAQANWLVVGVILVVLVIVVLTFVLIGFNKSMDVDLQACHDSALLRGAASSASGALTNVISLTCKTKRICVVSDKQTTSKKCDEDLGKGKYTKLTVTGNQGQKNDSVKMIIAREMASCWNTLGEGNLKVFKSELKASSTNTFAQAVICSRIYFDPQLVQEIDGEHFTGFGVYLLSHKSPNRDVSYWDYFRNTPDGDTLQIIAGSSIKTEQQDIMNLSKQKAVMYTEYSPNQVGTAVGAIAGGVTASALLYGVAGGAGGKAVGFIGTATGMGAGNANALVIGGATKFGASIAQEAYIKMFTDFQTDKAIAGLFLRDYTPEGFEELQKNKVQFNSIS